LDANIADLNAPLKRHEWESCSEFRLGFKRLHFNCQLINRIPPSLPFFCTWDLTACWRYSQLGMQ